MGERRGDRAVGELAAGQLAGRAACRRSYGGADELAFNPRDTAQFCTFRGEAGGLADGARDEPGVELARAGGVRGDGGRHVLRAHRRQVRKRRRHRRVRASV